ARHRDVEDRQVDVPLQRLVYRFGAVLGFGHDLQVRLRVEDLPQPGADDRVVVGDQDPCDQRDAHQLATPTRSTASVAGTSSRTSTPPPAACLIASAPPTSTDRSRMPRRPPFSSGTPLKPRPSSTTRSTTLPGPDSRPILTWRACA